MGAIIIFGVIGLMVLICCASRPDSWEKKEIKKRGYVCACGGIIGEDCNYSVEDSKLHHCLVDDKRLLTLTIECSRCSSKIMIEKNIIRSVLNKHGLGSPEFMDVAEFIKKSDYRRKLHLKCQEYFNKRAKEEFEREAKTCYCCND